MTGEGLFVVDHTDIGLAVLHAVVERRDNRPRAGLAAARVPVAAGYRGDHGELAQRQRLTRRARCQGQCLTSAASLASILSRFACMRASTAGRTLGLMGRGMTPLCGTCQTPFAGRFEAVLVGGEVGIALRSRVWAGQARRWGESCSPVSPGEALLDDVLELCLGGWRNEVRRCENRPLCAHQHRCRTRLVTIIQPSRELAELLIEVL